MAKFGEGDKRWIVDDLGAAGANVHNWHWAEKDCLEWARKRISELLSGVEVLQGEGGLWLAITGLDSCEGDAYVNIRKGKIIPGYELHVKLSWSGQAKSDSGQPVGKAEGKVELPYLADENADEDAEIRISAADESSLGARMREAMLKHGKPLVAKAIAIFVKEMAAGGPAKDELAGRGGPAGGAGAKPPASSAPAPPPGGAPAAESKAVSDAGGKAQARAAERGERGKRTISLTERFLCRESDIYETLLDERRWKAFTQADASIAPSEGGTLSLFNGAVTGVFQKLEPHSLIMMKWRFNSWSDGQYSTVVISLSSPESGVTILKLTHTNLPEEDKFGNATVVETTERGWRELIFHRIKVIFGYGA